MTRIRVFIADSLGCLFVAGVLGLPFFALLWR